jgi:ABC-type branched-subunit amino acid transport system ATPase component
VDDEPSLLVLQEAAEGIDPVLSEAVWRKIEGITGKNYVTSRMAEGEATIRVGNYYPEAGLGYMR